MEVNFYLIMVIGAFSLFMAVLFWLQIDDARYTRKIALTEGLESASKQQSKRKLS